MNGHDKYGYLFSSWDDIEDLNQKRDELAAMRDRLHELGIHDAATQTQDVLRLMDEVTKVAHALSNIWRAVELSESKETFDRDSVSVTGAVDEWRQKVALAPHRVDLARRAYELEAEAKKLRNAVAGMVP